MNTMRAMLCDTDSRAVAGLGQHHVRAGGLTQRWVVLHLPRRSLGHARLLPEGLPLHLPNSRLPLNHLWHTELRSRLRHAVGRTARRVHGCLAGNLGPLRLAHGWRGGPRLAVHQACEGPGVLLLA